MAPLQAMVQPMAQKPKSTYDLHNQKISDTKPWEMQVSSTAKIHTI